MNKLVLGNILYRPLRTFISVVAVAIEVVMILSIVAIMVGQVTSASRQTGGIGADIIVRPPNASFISSVGRRARPGKDRRGSAQAAPRRTLPRPSSPT